MQLLENSHSSSTISYSTYDPDTQVMTIEFMNGSIYEYANVPQDEYESFVNASSAGKYFGAHIKDIYNFNKK
jgi:hypothetical protein